MRRKLVTVLIAMVFVMQSFVMTSFAANSSGVEGFVIRCYDIALGRSPDEGGIRGWCQKLRNGEACGVSVAYGFVYSSEFQNAGYSDSEYVERMYSMLLGRESDPDGKASWVSKLEAGEDRETIFAGFANSEEFYKLCKSYGVFSGYYISGSGMERNAAINSFVGKLYSICLRRRGDQAGQGAWVSKLASGEIDGSTAAYGFIYSPEYIGRDTTNGEYVEMLYSTFLGRTPDADSFNTWVKYLDYADLSREEVFNSFANSPEFTNICDSYGIVRGNAAYDSTLYTPIYKKYVKSYTELIKKLDDPNCYCYSPDSGSTYFYDEDFYNLFVDVGWWHYDGDTSSYYFFKADVDTIAYSLQFKEDANYGEVTYDYFYLYNGTYYLVYSNTISPKVYTNGTYYDIDFEGTHEVGTYLLIVTDTLTGEVLMQAYCGVR